MYNSLEKQIKAYNRQPEVYKKILQLKSLLFTDNKAEFLTCLKINGIKPGPGKNFNHSNLRTIYAVLDNEGLFEDGDYINYSLRHYIAKEALLTKSYEKRVIEKDMLLEVEKVIKEKSIPDTIKEYLLSLEEPEPESYFRQHEYMKKQEKIFVQKLYLAVYENDTEFFREFFSPVKEENKEPVGDWTPDDYLEDTTNNITGGHQQAFAERKFVKLCNVFINTFYKVSISDKRWCEDRNDYIKLLFCFTKFTSINGISKVRQPNFKYWVGQYNSNEKLREIFLYKNLIHYYINIDLALGIFSRDKYVKIYKDACDDVFIPGIQYFIDGDFEQAKTSLINSLKMLRKSKGSAYATRNIALKFLILLYLSDTITVSRAKTEINKLKSFFTDLHDEFVFWDLLLELQEGNFKGAEFKFKILNFAVYSGDDDIVKFMLYLILQYFLNEKQIKKSISGYIEKFKTFRNDGLLFHAHLLAELILRFVEDDQDCKSFLELETPYKNFRLLSLFKKKEEWEFKLEVLAKLISDKKNVTRKKNIEQKRVIWQLDVDELILTPVEQKVLKNGNWSKGRNIAISRLYNKDKKLGYFTDHDWRIAHCAKKSYYGYGSEHYIDNSEALMAIVGHPLIFNEDNGINIEIYKGNLEVIVKENNGKYKISLSHYNDEAEPVLIKETDTRYKLLNFDDNAVKVAELLTEKGLTVPAEKKDEVEKIQKNLKHNYVLRSNIDDKSVPFVEADSRLIMHLLPIDTGLKVNLWVRPFKESGPYLRPGHGEKIQTAFLTDKSGIEARYKVKRDLKQEKDNTEFLMKQIQILEDSNSDADEWVFEEVSDCLELLEQVNEYKANNELLLEWPKGENLKLKQTVSHNNLKLKVQAKNDWFEFDGDIKLDDGTVVKLKYLLDNLNSIERRFIKLSDGKFLGLTDKFRKHLEELRSVAEKNKVHYLGTGVLQDIQDEGAETEVDEKWAAHIEKINNLKMHNPRIPRTLSAELRDYQKDGFKYLSRLAHWGVGGCLADDMGLGKTVQSIALLLEKSKKGASIVVAPTSVCFTWIEEINKFAPTLNVHYFADAKDREKLVKSLKKMDVLICSYGLMQLNRGILAAKKWQLVIMDEAQAIKNPNTKRWKAATALIAESRFALSGTPIENHLGELWSIFRFLNPGQLGSYKSFQTKFMNPIEDNKNAHEKKILKNLLSPFILRRIKTDVLDELPPKTEQNIIIEAGEEEKAFYEACRLKAVENIQNIADSEKSNTRFNVLAEITKLRQACCHSSLVDSKLNLENSKIKVFLQTVDKLIDNNHRALVFSQYVRFLEIIKKALDKRKIKYNYIDGSTPPKERQKAVESFQNGDSDLFLLSLKAGGTGLNLTAADYVIHLDPWWNPAVEDQASDRAHRIGQERPVTVYRLIMKNTIEEKIIALHKEKRNLAEDILSGADVAARISEDELMKLLRG